MAIATFQAVSVGLRYRGQDQSTALQLQKGLSFSLVMSRPLPSFPPCTLVVFDIFFCVVNVEIVPGSNVDIKTTESSIQIYSAHCNETE